MRSISVIFLLILVVQLHLFPQEIRGYVKIKGTPQRPLVGALIKGVGSNQAQTGSEGTFALRFQGQNIGGPAKLQIGNRGNFTVANIRYRYCEPVLVQSIIIPRNPEDSVTILVEPATNTTKPETIERDEQRIREYQQQHQDNYKVNRKLDRIDEKVGYLAEKLNELATPVSPQLAKANEYYKKGDYQSSLQAISTERAMSEIERADKLRIRAIQDLLFKARLFAVTGMYDSSYSVYTALIKIDSSNIELLKEFVFVMGSKLKGGNDETLSRLTKALRLSTTPHDSAECIAILAVHNLRNRAFGEALSLYERAFNISKRDDDADTTKANLFLAAVAADASSSAFLAQDSTRGIYWHRVAFDYYNQKAHSDGSYYRYIGDLIENLRFNMRAYWVSKYPNLHIDEEAFDKFALPSDERLRQLASYLNAIHYFEGEVLKASRGNEKPLATIDIRYGARTYFLDGVLIDRHFPGMNYGLNKLYLCLSLLNAASVCPRLPSEEKMLDINEECDVEDAISMCQQALKLLPSAIEADTSRLTVAQLILWRWSLLEYYYGNTYEGIKLGVRTLDTMRELLRRKPEPRSGQIASYTSGVVTLLNKCVNSLEDSVGYNLGQREVKFLRSSFNNLATDNELFDILRVSYTWVKNIITALGSREESRNYMLAAGEKELDRIKRLAKDRLSTSLDSRWQQELMAFDELERLLAEAIKIPAQSIAVNFKNRTAYRFLDHASNLSALGPQNLSLASAEREEGLRRLMAILSEYTDSCRYFGAVTSSLCYIIRFEYQFGRPTRLPEEIDSLVRRVEKYGSECADVFQSADFLSIVLMDIALKVRQCRFNEALEGFWAARQQRVEFPREFFPLLLVAGIMEGDSRSVKFFSTVIEPTIPAMVLVRPSSGAGIPFELVPLGEWIERMNIELRSCPNNDTSRIELAIRLLKERTDK